MGPRVRADALVTILGVKNRRPASRRAFEGRKLLTNARMATEPFPRAQFNKALQISQGRKPDFGIPLNI
jgi:hypothetical protein